MSGRIWVAWLTHARFRALENRDAEDPVPTGDLLTDNPAPYATRAHLCAVAPGAPFPLEEGRTLCGRTHPGGVGGAAVYFTERDPGGLHQTIPKCHQCELSRKAAERGR